MRASPQAETNEADTEEGLQKAMGDPEEEEEPEQPEEENVKKHWRVWKALKFPLQPSGVTAAEVSVDLWQEFGPILEESRKSLKRSMLFVGGIVRAYMRRGHKKDEWVAMVRKLEARVETTQNASDMGLADPSSASSSSLRPSSSLLLDSPNSTLLPGNSSAIVSTIWMAISDIYKYRAVPSVKAPLTKQLNYMYANYPTDVEFYLPQLANLLLCNKDFPLSDFVFDSCRSEPHFAIQTYFLISSMSQIGSAKWQKRCIKTLKQLVKAIPPAPIPGLAPIVKKSRAPITFGASTPSSVDGNPPSADGKACGDGNATLDFSSSLLSTAGDSSSRPSSDLAHSLSREHESSAEDATTPLHSTVPMDVPKEFPLGLPTDDHHLMLLLSPRTSASIPIPTPSNIRNSAPGISPNVRDRANENSPSDKSLHAHSTSDSILLDRQSHSPDHPLPFPSLLTSVTDEEEEARPAKHSNRLPFSIEVPILIGASDSSLMKSSSGSGSSLSSSNNDTQKQPTTDSASPAPTNLVHLTSCQIDAEVSGGLIGSGLVPSSITAEAGGGTKETADSIASVYRPSSRPMVTPPIQITLTSSSSQLKSVRDDLHDSMGTSIGANSLVGSIDLLGTSFSEEGYRGDDNKSDGGDDHEEDDEEGRNEGGSNQSTSNVSSSTKPSKHSNSGGKSLKRKSTRSKTPHSGGKESPTTTLSSTSAIPIQLQNSSSSSSAYKSVPEHLYMCSPGNSPGVTESMMAAMHALRSKNASGSSATTAESANTVSTSTQTSSSQIDLTSELKAALSAAAEAVERDSKSGASPSPFAALTEPSTSQTASIGDTNGGQGNLQTSSQSTEGKKHKSSSGLLAVPHDDGSISESYNSDDPEQELKKLTRITKPPSAPRVEKNLEVPVGKEYFFTQIKFMRKLIDVSRKLGELYGKPELYKPQLDKELEALTPYIESGYACIPTQNGVRTRVLRFAYQDCHPIQTYGRVLYMMIMEVVDLPAHYSKEMADEYVRLTKDIRKMAASPTSSSQALGEGEQSDNSLSGSSNSIPSASSSSPASQSTPTDRKTSSATSNASTTPSRELHPTTKFRISSFADHHKGMLTSSSLPIITSASSSMHSSSNSSESKDAVATETKNPASFSAFGDAWKDVRRRLKAQSIYSALPHWDVRAYIVKHGDLVLQEQFVMQLLVQFQHIWDLEGLPLKLNCYNILATSYQSGLIEVVPNSISLDKLKKVTERYSTSGSTPLSLCEFFKKQWPAGEEYKRARTNFISSLASYSVVCYLLQIKDRHNGNIMLDADGHLFHIDFGYLLARTIKFERAPFKLTDEFIEVLGGDESKYFKTYANLCVNGFLAARKHYEKILILVQMSAGEGAAIPCLDGEHVAPQLQSRFHLDWSEKQCEEFFLEMITDARDNWRTQIYDTYQRIVNDIH